MIDDKIIIATTTFVIPSERSDEESPAEGDFFYSGHITDSIKSSAGDFSLLRQLADLFEMTFLHNCRCRVVLLKIILTLFKVKYGKNLPESFSWMDSLNMEFCGVLARAAFGKMNSFGVIFCS